MKRTAAVGEQTLLSPPPCEMFSSRISIVAYFLCVATSKGRLANSYV